MEKTTLFLNHRTWRINPSGAVSKEVVVQLPKGVTIVATEVLERAFRYKNSITISVQTDYRHSFPRPYLVFPSDGKFVYKYFKILQEKGIRVE